VIRARTPSWAGSSTGPAPTQAGGSPLTSPGRCPSGPATGHAGRGAHVPSGCGRPSIAATASATSTAAAPSAMTRSGAWSTSTRGRRSCPGRSRRSAPSGRAAAGCPSSAVPGRWTRPRGDPPPGRAGERGAVLHPDERVPGHLGARSGPFRAFVMGGPDHLPHRAGPHTPGLPALAQRHRPPPRHPGCPDRPAPRPRPRPRPPRTPAPPGPVPAASRMIRPGERSWTAR